jgi:hypothetical protein
MVETIAGCLNHPQTEVEAAGHFYGMIRFVTLFFPSLPMSSIASGRNVFSPISKMTDLYGKNMKS